MITEILDKLIDSHARLLAWILSLFLRILKSILSDYWIERIQGGLKPFLDQWYRCQNVDLEEVPKDVMKTMNTQEDQTQDVNEMKEGNA